MAHVNFLLFDGFSNMVLACLMEPLRAVRDQGEALSWSVLSVDDRPVRSSSGLAISPDEPVQVARAADLLIVVSGYGFRAHARAEATAQVRRLARRAGDILGADSGAWVLAAAGLLEGLKATLHWAVLSDFAEEFPQVQVSYDRYIREGRIWTCGGASTALDLILAYISENFGPASAFLASTMFLYDAEREQPQSRRPRHLADRSSSPLRRCVNLMVETIEEPLALAQLAERAGLTLRTMDRLFRAELAMPPGRYYQQLRLSRARDLSASTEFDLREIALRCGYSDAAALSKAFRRAYGHPIRKSHGTRPR